MTPYLILHKVRGEPAFDIAIPIQIGDEEGWIIPTSGHRAYPYWTADLTLTYTSYDACCNGNNVIEASQGEFGHIMPPNWPDHYTCNSSPREALTSAISRSVLAALGLGPKVVKRRKV